MIRVMLPAALLVWFLPHVADAGSPPAQLKAYMPIVIHYAPYAESLWHPAGRGGYWGDGLSGGNGGIRGTSNLTLVMAWLVQAYDEGWLKEAHEAALAAAGLDRATCLRRVREAWTYLAESHRTGGGAARDGKQWGRSWQSSLWVGASGLAALLVWEHLDEDLQDRIRRVLVDEADAKLGVVPRDARPGNTAAEENGWDTHAPAVALALCPQHPHAAGWLRAAQLLAVNTYSAPADRQSETRVGRDRLRDVVCTANLAPDFTLDNHGFFHPSYVKVSGQELGEAWVILALGDRRHGTNYAAAFKPYAMHHLGDVWNKVLLPLLLPEGEFAFPAGQDWALHTGTTQSYFAFVATALQDPLAALAERRGVEIAQFQMRASPSGRIYGQGDFEWWSEPILLKRYVTAMLHFLLAARVPEPAEESALTARDEYRRFPDAQMMVCRTPRYFTSLSLRPTPTALIIPLGEHHLEHPHVVTPRVGSILPAGTIVDDAEHSRPAGRGVVMTYSDGTQAAMVAARNTVLWLSNRPLHPLAIQNDALVTGRGRQIHFASGSRHVPPLVPMEPFRVAGTWINIDGQLGLVSPQGFDYRPAGGLTRRSAAEDLVAPRPGRDGTLLLAGPRFSAEQTRDLAESLRASADFGHWKVQYREGPSEPALRIHVGLVPAPTPSAPLDLQVHGQVSDRSPLANLTDGDPATCVVLRNKAGTGPSSGGPIAIEFRRPAEVPLGSWLRVVPRPAYGPRDVILEVHRGGGWQAIGKATLHDGPADIASPADPPGERFRLTITSGWDRGSKSGAPPRNTQIGELAWMPVMDKDRRFGAASVAFDIRVEE